MAKANANPDGSPRVVPDRPVLGELENFLQRQTVEKILKPLFYAMCTALGFDVLIVPSTFKCPRSIIL